ncbi:MAG: hypothetical protein KIT31_20025 [Deltaproteobacteria bacterium]|nr:hypothetical protein [Deltaproteobacteria bacterium]
MIRVLLAVLVLLAACARTSDGEEEHRDGPPAQRAFYYWRTTLRLSDAERRAVTELGVARIYLRMFDVVWQDGAAAQVGVVAVEDRLPTGVEVVPVVFVRDEVLRRLPRKQLPELAQRTWDTVAERMKLLGGAPRELQLDCDWTDSTRDAYFDLVRRVRELARGVALSATIRLHQIKYRERTGVPPVDRGMLMFYNMGKLVADREARAIFDAGTAEKYLARIADYPLPLDAALPIWAWALHVRDDRVVDLLQRTDPDDLARADFLRPDGPDRYVATRTTFLDGAMLREGDQLKVEAMGPAEALTAARMLAPRLAAALPGAPRTVSLFDLSERNLRRHGKDQLDQVFRAVR